MTEFPFLFSTPWPWWAFAFAAGGAGFLTWRGYGLRRRELKPRLYAWLQVLRMCGWVLLFLCLLQPVYRKFVPEEHASRVTVLVDDSESMSFTDGGKASRLDRARAVLGNQDDAASLLGRLHRSFQVKLEGFSSDSRIVEGPQELTGQGERTDLAKALASSFARLKGPDAGGLILISDGADTAKGDLARVAQTFRRAGVPIYALGVGARDVADLSIAQVRCRRAVSKDTLVRVEVDVARVNVPAGTFPVRITRKGRTVKEVAVNLTSDKATVTFEFLPEEQGFQDYEAVIEPYVGEAVISNNTLAFGFVAFSRKLRVLYMEGSQYQHSSYFRHIWRNKWEHEFMKDALEEDHDVEVDVLFKEDPDAYTGKIKTVKVGYPKTKKELYQYDVIINSDIPYKHFNANQVQWTVDFVAKHGGGFCMIGGYDAFGKGGYANTSMDRMLPVQMLDGGHVDKVDFRWSITDKGWKHPIMQIDPKDPKRNQEIWEKLNTLGDGGGPAFHGWSITTRYKPAADVLAVIDDDRNEGVGAYGPMVLVAVQPFGRGRSMAFTTDCTGSWGAEWEDSWGDDINDPDRRNIYYKIFWKNTIRWLAHYRMQAPNQLVQIETSQLVYGRGERPEVRVKVLNEDYEPTHEAKVELTVLDPQGRQQSYTLFPKYEEPGVYERKLEVSTIGRYELAAVATLKSEELGRDQTILQIRPSTDELRRLGQDEEALVRLAKGSGGEYLPLEDAGKLGDLLRQDTHVIQRHRDWDLWDNAWMFAGIIALFCTEWFLRKKNGLP